MYITIQKIDFKRKNVLRKTNRAVDLRLDTKTENRLYSKSDELFKAKGALYSQDRNSAR